MTPRSRKEGYVREERGEPRKVNSNSNPNLFGTIRNNVQTLKHSEQVQSKKKQQNCITLYHQVHRSFIQSFMLQCAVSCIQCPKWIYQKGIYPAGHGQPILASCLWTPGQMA